MPDLSLLAAGAFTGFLVGLTGVGGGALVTPLLLLFFGIAPVTAVGTDLWFASLTKLLATRVHHHHGLIDWQVVRRLWAGSLPASAITLVLMNWFSPGSQSLAFLKFAIGIAVLITALGVVMQKYLHDFGRRFRLTEESRFKRMQAPMTVFSGVVLGVLVTLTSVGAGALGAVLLTYLYPLRLTPPRLIASDIVHAIPLAMFAGLGHLVIGHVDFGLLGNLLLGSLPAVVLGAMVSSRLPHQWLRWALSIVLFSVSFKLLLS